MAKEQPATPMTPMQVTAVIRDLLQRVATLESMFRHEPPAPGPQAPPLAEPLTDAVAVEDGLELP